MVSPRALRAIPDLRRRYYGALPGKESLVQMLTEAEVADQVYNSNAIENSTLTIEETEKILMEIELERYVTEREIFEAKNLARVVEYTNKKATSRELDLDTILLLHQMLISNIRNEIAGRFREPGEYVRVGNHIAPSPEELSDRLGEALREYQASAGDHIVTRLSRLHLEFEHTHPFVDGNGRIGRVVNNYLLVREGYVPINIKFIDRANYYDALHEYDETGRIEIMSDIITKALTNSYYKRLAYLEGKTIVKLADYAKKVDRSHSALLNMAHRQTIEAFLERGVWKIASDLFDMNNE